MSRRQVPDDVEQWKNMIFALQHYGTMALERRKGFEEPWKVPKSDPEWTTRKKKLPSDSSIPHYLEQSTREKYQYADGIYEGQTK